MTPRSQTLRWSGQRWVKLCHEHHKTKSNSTNPIYVHCTVYTKKSYGLITQNVIFTKCIESIKLVQKLVVWSRLCQIKLVLTVDALPNCLPKASIKGENDSFCAVFGRHSASSPNLAPNPARVDLETVFIRSWRRSHPDRTLMSEVHLPSEAHHQGKSARCWYRSRERSDRKLIQS